jgi:hypothetical protein
MDFECVPGVQRAYHAARPRSQEGDRASCHCCVTTCGVVTPGRACVRTSVRRHAVHGADTRYRMGGAAIRRVSALPRPDCAEVALVQRGQLLLAEAFHDARHGRVHEPQIGVRMTVAEQPDTYGDVGVRMARGTCCNSRTLRRIAYRGCSRAHRSLLAGLTTFRGSSPAAPRTFPFRARPSHLVLRRKRGSPPQPRDA